MLLKGYIFDIKRFALHDGPGIRTTVFLTGCPLRCWWCHNPESLRNITGAELGTKEDDIFCASEVMPDIQEYSAESLLAEIKKDLIFYEESAGGITFSGGEPLMQIDFLHSVLASCKENYIHTAIDTSGYTDFNRIEKIYSLTDLFLFDLKIMNRDDHFKYTGVDNSLIHKNLLALSGLGNKIRIRVPLIPGITDTNENLNSILSFVNQMTGIIQVDLLPYNKLSESKYKRIGVKLKLGEIKSQEDHKLNEIIRLFSDCKFPVKLRG